MLGAAEREGLEWAGLHRGAGGSQMSSWCPCCPRHAVSRSVYIHCKWTTAACSSWHTELQGSWQLPPSPTFSLCLSLFFPSLIHSSVSWTVSAFQEPG